MITRLNPEDVQAFNRATGGFPDSIVHSIFVTNFSRLSLPEAVAPKSGTIITIDFECRYAEGMTASRWVRLKLTLADVLNFKLNGKTSSNCHIVFDRMLLHTIDGKFYLNMEEVGDSPSSADLEALDGFIACTHVQIEITELDSCVLD